MFLERKEIDFGCRHFLSDLLEPNFLYVKKYLHNLRIEPLHIPEVTVWGETAYEFQDFSDQRWDWSHRYPSDLSEVKEAFSKLCNKTKVTDPEFDIKNISMVCASKSFSNEKIKVLRNVEEWSQVLFEDSNLRFSSDEDFSINIRHVTSEATSSTDRRHLSLIYYDWHNRYKLSNNGGSHHFVALIRQIKDQNRSLTWHSEITNYRLNTKPIYSLREKYYIFIADDNISKEESKTNFSIIFQRLFSSVLKVKFPQRCSNLTIFILAKKRLAPMTLKVFDDWLAEQIDLLRVVDFYQFLEGCK